ncbi:hypothetical protein F2P81_016897 [Scophthalmus maximus]|uniref:Peptidase S54 rhomboid domain-containing protein n=1 Tax=Scophthalmus maximus TaxID=52904 RepID=A0A6A4S4N6_SCOMX|nr:hypothetical protein F2P81_016897 [Scophthalmus maximus]
MRHRQRGSHLGLMLLASQVFRVGLDNIPPVTLGVLALNLYLYLFPAAPLLKACVSVQQAYWFNDWRRLLLSPLHHVDDWHLYFNMASFLWKGISLEQRLGGPWFFYLLSVFSLLTGVVYLVLEAVLTELMQDQSYSTTCAVGFSGYGGTSGQYPGNHQYAPDNTSNHTASYSGGLTEEEQLEAAIRNSLNDRGQRSQRGAPPPYGFDLSEEARAEEIRRDPHPPTYNYLADFALLSSLPLGGTQCDFLFHNQRPCTPTPLELVGMIAARDGRKAMSVQNRDEDDD